MLTNNDILRLSEPVEEMYMNVTSELLINLARHFKTGKDLPIEAWELEKLSELGAVTRESIAIILKGAGKKREAAIRKALTEAAMLSLKDNEKILQAAAEKGVITTVAGDLSTSKRVKNVVENFVGQAYDDTNLVNTVMLESVQTRYRQAINDVKRAEEAQKISKLTKAVDELTLASQMGSAQEILNTAAGEVVLGAKSRNAAVRAAITKMAKQGITGFIDSAGHHWTPEAYVNMDIRTTVNNTALHAQQARSADYDVNTFQVSTKAAARPLCAEWQGRILSWLPGDRGVVYDLHGKAYQYISVYDTSYGQAAGLFGINCGHSANTFVDGYSAARYQELTAKEEKENAVRYEETQQQRSLERQVRDWKTKALMYDASGDKAAFENASLKIKEKQSAYREFCADKDLTQRPDRLQVMATPFGGAGYDRSMAAKVTAATRKQKEV